MEFSIEKKQKIAKSVINIICVVTILTMVGETISGGSIKILNLIDYFDMAMRLFFSAFLVIGYFKKNYLAIQAGCAGLLVSITYYQANFVLDYLLLLDTEKFIAMGFWGSFFLAIQLMALILEIMFLLNHYMLFVLKKVDRTRLAVNLTLILILMLVLLFQVVVITNLQFDAAYCRYLIYYTIGLVASFVLIAYGEGALYNGGEENDK